MFMDRQELNYSFKFIKGDFKQKGLQYLFGIIFLAIFSIFNVIMNSLNIFVSEINMTTIVTFQNFSTSALFAMVVFPVVYYIFTYRKNTTANQIYPQTNNTRFVKDFAIGFCLIMLLIATYIFSYLGSFGIAYLFAFLRPDAVVATPVEIINLLISCFSLLMYGLLALSFFILCAAVIRKIKLYSLIFPLVLVVLLSTKFMETVNMIVEIAKFYVSEGSILVFALKILITIAVFMLLSFVINNKTAVENSVNYKNILSIIFCLLLVLATAASGFFVLNVSFTDDGYSLEPDINIEESPYQKIEIDISDIEIGTYMNMDISGIDDYSNDSDETYMKKSNYNFPEPLITESYKLVVYYNFMECSENLNFDIKDYTSENFDAYVKDETLYLSYEVAEPINLININSSFLINQFDIVKDEVSYMNYTYIHEASCFIAFE